MRGFKPAKRYTHRSAFKDYLKLLEDKGSALSFRQYDKFIAGFFRKLNRKIIVDKYEWKLPNRLGYIRISKNKKNFFFWYWDKNNPYTAIPKKLLWSFRPVTDWVTKQIGQRGLVLHYFALKENNKAENYDVPIIDHRIKLR